MATRYMSVRSRSLLALKAKLEQITQANGFNTDVQNVEITRIPSLEPLCDAQIEIVVTPGDTEMSCNGRRYHHIPLELWCWRRKIIDPDSEYSLFLCDVQRCLECPFQDPSHPHPEQTGIWCEPGEDKPLYDTPGDNTMFGLFEYTLEYFRSENDARLWDDTSDQLVPVVEKVL